MAASKSSAPRKKAYPPLRAKPSPGATAIEPAAPQAKTKPQVRGGKAVALAASDRQVPPHRPKAKAAVGRHATPGVSVVTAGGYTVFGSPVRPAHLTAEQIAAAIADLD